MIRLPPDSCIQRQLWNESPVRMKGGTVVTVLSKFCILTVFSVTSSTVPSTLYFGILIQSPGLNILLADNMTPATNPMIVSLNISIRIAAEAPNPASSFSGERPISRLVTTIAAKKNRPTCRI